MAKYWCYFLFLLWFSYLILSSVLLFTGGFLLTRVTHNINSSCETLEDSCTTDSLTKGKVRNCVEDNGTSILNSPQHICLPQRANVILLVIDGLRYDFTTYNHSLQEEVLPFQNKLPVVSKLLKIHADSTRLYKFIADPPTTTMQRLKALTTGSLPTFIDAGSNFATSEINEDNIIDQSIKNNRKVIFMGDDTWMGLYPNRFNRSYPYPSFNVHDLDTVDIGVFTNLYPEIKRNDYDVLIAHFLGVDHCGHRYGPYHSEMSRKLNEMNDVIEKVANELNDNTVLIVIGDHGMTTTGDHGGASENEVTSAMFIHAKKSLVKLNWDLETVKQIDLVPTLSTILGIPIPFPNLGSVILTSLPATGKSEWKDVLFILWSNVQQMHQYLKEYSKSTHTFKEADLKMFEEKYNHLRSKLSQIKSKEDFEKFAKDARDFMISLREMCEEVWIEFDSFSMSRGLLLLFISTFFVYLIVDGIPSEQLQDIFMSSFLVCSYLALLLAVFISCILYYFKVVDDLLLNIYFSTGIMSLFMLMMLIIQNWEVIAMHWYERNKKNRFPNLILRVILLFNICGVFSNSFIVEEGNVLLYLLITIICFNMYNSTYSTNKTRSEKGYFKLKLQLIALVIIMTMLARLSVYFWQCREEQQWCLTHNSFSTHKSMGTSRINWTITLISLALLVTLTRIWLRSSGNLIGFSLTVTMARYTPTVIVVCIGGYWILHNLPKNTKNALLVPWQPDILTWVVYAFTISGILCSILKPLCIYILPKQQQYAVDDQRNVIPQIFQQLKNLFARKRDNNEDVPVVCGLATVYSSVYIVVGVYFCLLLSLLLGVFVAPSAVIMFLVTCLLIATISIARIQRVADFGHLLEPPGFSILALVILSQYFFYGTGHQPTFPNIVWDAAFIGTGGILKNNFISGALVVINTFGSYILVGLMLPLLIIMPFTLFVMMPSVVLKRADLQKDSSRGEILLYERSGKMLKSVFILCCKYIMCHSIKVFACMLAATIHCRHLMVWKIFAPKFIFDAIAMFITLGSVLVSYLILIQIHRKVDNLVYRLNKQNR